MAAFILQEEEELETEEAPVEEEEEVDLEE